MHACLHEQRQMGIGTEAPVSYQDVTRAQFGMESDDLREIMGEQGAANICRPAQSPLTAPTSAQRENHALGAVCRAGRNAFAGRGYRAWKTSHRPKRCDGPTAPLLERFVLQSVAHGAEQLCEHREREPHTRLTIGGSRHVELGEMTQVRARRIAVQNLDKTLDRRHGIERRSRHR